MHNDNKIFLSFLHRFIIVLLTAIAFNYLNIYCQDTVKYDILEYDSIHIKSHSPRKAVLLSTIIPGLGQAYNNKFWKIPLIYGAAGAMITYYNYNQVRYKEFVKHLDFIYEERSKDPNYKVEGYFTIYQHTLTNENELELGRDFYRRKRDMGLFYIAAVYLLNIVDAMVDAHFFSFDVTDDLSFNFQPAIINHNYLLSSTGFKISLNF